MQAVLKQMNAPGSTKLPLSVLLSFPPPFLKKKKAKPILVPLTITITMPLPVATGLPHKVDTVMDINY